MSLNFEKLTDRAKNAENVFNRDISCKVYRAENGVLSISRLVDQFHDITLAMLIDPTGFTVTEAFVKMERVPYEVCRKTADGIKNIKGLFILHPAVNREMRRKIKRKDGCTHLFELLEFTLQTLFTGGPRAGLNGEDLVKVDKELQPEEHRLLQMTNPRLKNTCLAFVPEE